jgi:hypothetical protein
MLSQPPALREARHLAVEGVLPTVHVRSEAVPAPHWHPACTSGKSRTKVPLQPNRLPEYLILIERSFSSSDPSRHPVREHQFYV